MDSDDLDFFLETYNAGRSHSDELRPFFAGPDHFSHLTHSAAQGFSGQAYYPTSPDPAGLPEYGDAGQQQQWQQAASEAASSGNDGRNLDFAVKAASQAVTTATWSTVTGTTRESVFSGEALSTMTSRSSVVAPRAPPGPTFAQFVAATPSLPAESVVSGGHHLPPSRAPSSARSAFGGVASSLGSAASERDASVDEAAAEMANLDMMGETRQYRPAPEWPPASIGKEDAASSYYLQSDCDYSQEAAAGLAQASTAAAARDGGSGPADRSRATPQLWCEYRRVSRCSAVFHPLDLQGWTAHHAQHMQWQYPRRLSCWYCPASFGGANEDMLERRMLHLHGHIVGPERLGKHDDRVDEQALDHMLRIREISKQAWRKAVRRNLPQPLRISAGSVEEQAGGGGEGAGGSQLVEERESRGGEQQEEAGGLRDALAEQARMIEHDLDRERRMQRRRGGRK